MSRSRTEHRARRSVVVATVAAVLLGGAVPAASAALTGTAPQLMRAPYLTDLTSTGVTVSWATTIQTKAVVRYGPAGDCAATSRQAGTTGTSFTVTAGGTNTTEYQNSLQLTGLSPGTAYCYRVWTADGSVDLLGTTPTPSFTTLDSAGSASPVTFAVLGDWGDTTNGGVNDGTLNADQAALDAQIAASGARFAVSTGDLGYPGGTQSNYGDLVHTGADVSGVFGPSYWAGAGGSTPLFAASGNHGRNSNYLTNWPEASTTAASSGVYAMTPYASVDGSTAGTYPSSYYAFSANGARFYVLDAAWSDGNVGTATGGACGSHCKSYQVDHDAHWTASSAEYLWLQNDLAAHPGGVKLAFFHYPLRSDDQTEPADVYLQNTPGSSGSLEQLLHDGGVGLAFNGHAHIYQRNVAPPGGVTSYVTGGGGARLTTVSKCAPTDAYALGWSYSSNHGSACGAATAAADDSAVFHFLKVTLSGSRVTVTPTDSTGRTFDAATYDLGPDAAAPTAPASPQVTLSGTTKAVLSWGAATDDVGVAAYDVYRNGIYLATVPPTVRTWTDATIIAGTSYTYRIDARDRADHATGAVVALNGGGAADTTPPSTPGGLTAAGVTETSVQLTWSAATDNVGVTSYTVLRGGVPIASVAAPSTGFTDTGLLPGTAYSYQVQARDAAGNVSPASSSLTATTLADTSPPTTPGTPVATSVTSSSVTLNWTMSGDDVGVVRYDVLRDGSVVGTAAGGAFTDTTVSPGTTYSYVVRAYDAAGNGTSSGARSVNTPTAGSLFSEDFESGGLGAWTTVSGLGVQNALAHTGSYAARETSTGTATYAYRSLPSGAGELWAQAWVYVASRSTSANLFGFRTSGGASIVNLYVDTSGRVSLRNNIGSVTTYSTTQMPLGSWHRMVLHASVNGAASTVDVQMDGAAVPGLTLTGQDLGTGLLSKLQLGETATGRTYDIVLDDVAVSAAAL